MINYNPLPDNAFLFFLSAMILNFFILINLKKILINYSIVDKPDKIRKFHKKKAYLFGGILIFVNVSFFYIFHNINFQYVYPNPLHFYSFFHSIFFYIFFFIFFCIGLYDDKYSLDPYKKLFSFALFFYLCTTVNSNLLITNLNFKDLEFEIPLNNSSQIFTVLCFVILCNALNMFDGQNLQLSIFSITIFAFLTLISFNIFTYIFMIFVLIIFSILNRKGLIFLGDSGSILLSYLISYCIILEYNFNVNFYADQIALILLLPILDLLRLFFVRIYKGSSPFKADRFHIHHILTSYYGFKVSSVIIFLLYTFPIFLHFVINLKTYYAIFIMLILYLLILKKYHFNN